MGLLVDLDKPVVARLPALFLQASLPLLGLSMEGFGPSSLSTAAVHAEEAFENHSWMPVDSS